MTEEKQEKLLDTPMSPELSKQVDDLINKRVHEIRLDVLRNRKKYQTMYAHVLKTLKQKPDSKPQVKPFNRPIEEKKEDK